MRIVMDHQDAGDGEERQQQLDDRDDEQDHVLSSPPEEDGNQEPLEIDKESVVQQLQVPLPPPSSWRAAAASFSLQGEPVPLALPQPAATRASGQG